MNQEDALKDLQEQGLRLASYNEAGIKSFWVTDIA